MENISTPYSSVWERLKTQQNDEVSDLVVLFPYTVRRNDRSNKPILTTFGSIQLSELGKEVESILKNASLHNCQIAEYSINPYQVGKEKSNNRLSMLVHAHWNKPISSDEARSKLREEVTMAIVTPIERILNANNSYLSMSCYNYGDSLTKWEDFEELIMCGLGHRFTKGHFTDPLTSK